MDKDTATDAAPGAPFDWRSLLDERQAKEVAFARIYVDDFGHGTTGHNQLVLIARLAALLDELTTTGRLTRPDPAERGLAFGKYRGMTLGQLVALDPDYLNWLANEAREDDLRRDAAAVLLAASEAQPDGAPPDLPF